MAGEATSNFGHVGDTITADIVDTNVQHVSTFANLFGGHLGAGIPIGGQHCIAECARAVGVGTFADVQHAVVLFQHDGRVQRSNAWFLLRRATQWGDVAYGFDHLAQVFGCGATAATHHVDAKFLHVVSMKLS